jgi:hypothetical protein
MSTMDSDTTDLIRKLCTRAGMLMEDMSLLAITAPADRPGALQEIVRTLLPGCDDMHALIAAAEILARGER